MSIQWSEKQQAVIDARAVLCLYQRQPVQAKPQFLWKD